MDTISWPPAYVVVPVALARARDQGVEGRLVATMLSILALCWDRETSPPLPPDDLARVLGLSRASLYRHLARLGDAEGGLGWLRVESQDRCLSLRPLLQVRPRSARRPAGLRPDPDLARALDAIGVAEPKRTELACRAIDPAWVRAWYLWSRDPARRNLANPTGAVIRKLEEGASPPDAFLRAAHRSLANPTGAVIRKLEEGHPPPDTFLRAARRDLAPPPPDPPPPGPPPDGPAALWQRTLVELARCLYRPVFDLHLSRSYVAPGGLGDDDCLTVTVPRANSLPWLNGGLAPIVRRCLARCAGRDLEVRFVAA